MTIEVARKLIEALDRNIKEHELGNPFFTDPSYNVFSLSKENFEPIRQIKSERKIAFIDGGNQEVIGAANFSIQFNRLYFNIFKGQKRFHQSKLINRIEFFSATHSSFRNNEIYYDTSIFPLKEEHRELLPDEADVSFNSWDRTVTIGTMRADISRVASIARRFAEWQYATKVVEKELEKGDILVIDGSLQTAFTNENKYSKNLYEIAKARGVIVTGLSKTSGLFTNTGLSLLGAIQKLAEDANIEYGSWYFLVAEATSSDHEAMIFVVKLNSMAERIFRYEIHLEQFKRLAKSDIDEILSLLAVNSQDICFPGYPYGLVDADCFARVVSSEVVGYQALLFSEMARLGKWPKFARHIRAIDAHDVLNIIMGDQKWK
jgi:hypothetical protein